MTRREGVLATLCVLLGIGWASTSLLSTGAEPHTPSTIRIIKQQEGFRGLPYDDGGGHSTIGYGTLLPLSEAEGEWLLEYRLGKTEAEIAARWKPYADQPEHVKQVLTLMGYQLGVEGELKFKKMLGCLEQGDTRCAAREALDSQWEHQTPKRVAIVAALLEK